MFSIQSDNCAQFVRIFGIMNVGKNTRGKNAIGKNVRGKIAIGKNVRAKVVKIP